MKKFQTTMDQFLTDQRSRLSVMFLLRLFAFSALVLASVEGAGKLSDSFTVTPTQNAMTGEWTAEFSRSKQGEIQMTFHRSSAEGGFNMSSETVSLSEIQGLPVDVASSSKTNVNFQIVREAGTFVCEGYFHEGKGAGFWTFTASQNFVSAMRGRGYTNLTAEDLLRAALHNLTTKFIEDLKSVGYDRLEFEELIRAAGHDVTAAYIREMRAAGYDGLPIEELIRARNHDIDSQYIREVRAMGFDKQPLESVIRLRNHEITPEYVNDLKAEGYSDIPVEMIIRLKNHDVDRAFIERVKARGITNATLDDLIRLRSHDIIR